MSGSRSIYGALAIVAFVATAFAACKPSVGSGPKLTLTIEVTGGFAYVSPTAGDNHLNIAYLKSWRHDAERRQARPRGCV